MKYLKAPVSEVIFGINYSKQKMSTDDIFFLNTIFKDNFPLLEILPPLVVEDLNGFQLTQNLDPSISGPFLLRRRSIDNKWLLQIQSNRIYLNWIRNDSEPVGNYLGYSPIFSQFQEILDSLTKAFNFRVFDDIELLDLSYHDRIDWHEYLTELSKISELINISTPPIFSEEGYNNVFSKYSFLDSEINGFGLISINTASSMTGKQIIKVESNLRGKLINMSAVEWFQIAHKKQNYIFDKLFTQKIKDQWL